MDCFGFSCEWELINYCAISLFSCCLVRDMFVAWACFACGFALMFVSFCWFCLQLYWLFVVFLFWILLCFYVCVLGCWAIGFVVCVFRRFDC